MGEQDANRLIHAELRHDRIEVDYGAEYRRLVGALSQKIYEFRESRGAIGQPDVIAVARLQRSGVGYSILSRREGHVRVVMVGDSWAFEADIPTSQGSVPKLFSYETDAEGITEKTLGEDEQGCAAIAEAMRLLVRAGMTDHDILREEE